MSFDCSGNNSFPKLTSTPAVYGLAVCTPSAVAMAAF